MTIGELDRRVLKGFAHHTDEQRRLFKLLADACINFMNAIVHISTNAGVTVTASLQSRALMRCGAAILLLFLLVGCGREAAPDPIANLKPSEKTLAEVEAYLQPGMTTDQLHEFVRTTPILVGETRFHWMLSDGSLWTDFKPSNNGAIIVNTDTEKNAPVAAAASSSQSPPIPEPHSWSFPDVVESARAIAPMNFEGRRFDEHGLAYPLKELNALPFATMSAQELQKYADIVTHAYPDAVFLKVGTSCNELPIEKMNSTALANLAYVALHAVDSGTRQQAARCLEQNQMRLKNRQNAP